MKHDTFTTLLTLKWQLAPPVAQSSRLFYFYDKIFNSPRYKLPQNLSGGPITKPTRTRKDCLMGWVSKCSIVKFHVSNPKIVVKFVSSLGQAKLCFEWVFFDFMRNLFRFLIIILVVDFVDYTFVLFRNSEWPMHFHLFVKFKFT